MLLKPVYLFRESKCNYSYMEVSLPFKGAFSKKCGAITSLRPPHPCLGWPILSYCYTIPCMRGIESKKHNSLCNASGHTRQIDPNQTIACMQMIQKGIFLWNASLWKMKYIFFLNTFTADPVVLRQSPSTSSLWSPWNLVSESQVVFYATLPLIKFFLLRFWL